MQVFSNNAETVLAEPLSMNDTPATDHGIPFDQLGWPEELWPMVCEEEGRDRFVQLSYPPYPNWGEGGSVSVSDYDYQLATITNEAEYPGQFEVVRIYGWQYQGPAYVMRHDEMSEDYIETWPAGSKVSARVTAGMLESFVQRKAAEMLATFKLDSRGVPYLASPSGTDLSIGGPTNSSGDVTNIHGWGVLEENYFGVHSMGHGSPAPSLMSREMVVRTQTLWFSGAKNLDQYGWVKDHEVVVPTVPNGHQYLFTAAHVGYGVQIDPLNPPDFDSMDGDAPSPAYDDPDADEPDLLGHWIPAPYPVVNMPFRPAPSLGLYTSILLTEIGFVCEFCDSVTQPPVLRIVEEEYGDPTGRVLVDDVELDQIILGEGASVHRIPMSLGGALLQDVSITVTTPGGGEMSGWLYFKGVVFNVRPY